MPAATLRHIRRSPPPLQPAAWPLAADEWHGGDYWRELARTGWEFGHHKDTGKSSPGVERRRLSAIPLSLGLHALIAAVLAYAAARPIPVEPAQEAGVLSVQMVMLGNADSDIAPAIKQPNPEPVKVERAEPVISPDVPDLEPVIDPPREGWAILSAGRKHANADELTPPMKAVEPIPLPSQTAAIQTARPVLKIKTPTAETGQKAKAKPQAIQKPVDKKPQSSRKKRKDERRSEARPAQAKGELDGKAEAKVKANRSDGRRDVTTIGNGETSNYPGLVSRKLRQIVRRVRVRSSGTVVLAFTVLSDGTVSKARVSRSSGRPDLDKAALTALAKVGAFPPIPAEAGKEAWPMTVPIVFR